MTLQGPARPVLQAPGRCAAHTAPSVIIYYLGVDLLAQQHVLSLEDLQRQPLVEQGSLLNAAQAYGHLFSCLGLGSRIAVGVCYWEPSR